MELEARKSRGGALQFLRRVYWGASNAKQELSYGFWAPESAAQGRGRGRSKCSLALSDSWLKGPSWVHLPRAPFPTRWPTFLM